MDYNQIYYNYIIIYHYIFIDIIIIIRFNILP